MLFPRRGRFGGAVALLALAVAAGGLTSVPAASAAPPGVDPANVSVTLGPGGSTVITKTVHTPAVPPNPDLVFLADTTASMGGAIDNVKTNAASILSQVVAAQPSAQFGVAEYRDVEADAVSFAVNQNITADQAAVQAGINQWAASGGGNIPEDGINALWQLANGAVAFRSGGTRIVVIFGDAPSHEPSNGHSLVDTIAALQAADIRVVAVNVGNLNAGGQMQAITDGTGGVLLDNVPAEDVAAAILAGISAIQVTVTPSAVCDPQLSLAFNPASATVDSGSDAVFVETVNVAGTAAAGTYHCTVDFLIDGVSQGLVQQLTVVVPGLRINDVTVNESAGTASFTVTLDPASSQNVSVNYATANQTATAGADYTASNGTLTFTPGQTSKSVTVPIINDTVDELSETFRVDLSAASGAAIVDGLGIGTIVDNDRDGGFSCTATVLQIGSFTSTSANPANVPCVDDSTTKLTVNKTVGAVSVQLSALSAQTNQTPDNLNVAPAAGDNSTANARVETTKITVGGLVTIEVGVINSTASATCVTSGSGLVPQFAGSSTISSLKINGISVTVGSAPLTIPLLVGSLKLNSTTTTATSVTQQAFVLDTLLTDVVIASAHADVEGTSTHPSGNPCVV